jgi:hypothetical protein
MTPENTEEIRASILEGLEEDFTPYIQVQSLQVKPNYQDRFWEIHLVGVVPDYKTRIDSTSRIRSAG